MSLLFSVFGVVISPIGEFMFDIIAMKRLFFARSSEDYFKKCPKFYDDPDDSSVRSAQLSQFHCRHEADLMKYLDFNRYDLHRKYPNKAM